MKTTIDTVINFAMTTIERLEKQEKLIPVENVPFHRPKLMFPLINEKRVACSVKSYHVLRRKIHVHPNTVKKYLTKYLHPKLQHVNNICHHLPALKFKTLKYFLCEIDVWWPISRLKDMSGNSNVIMSLKITQKQRLGFCCGWLSVNVVEANQYFSSPYSLSIRNSTYSNVYTLTK
jgi:hypothetical protein